MAETTLARTVLTVPDMSCDHCVRTVTNALTPLAGVADVDVDLANKSVQVSYDPTLVDVGRMSAALADEDYPVASAQPATTL
jgi:copper chaperone CopZ